MSLISCSVWPPGGARANEAATAISVPWSGPEGFAAWLATPLASTNKHEQAYSPLTGIAPGKHGRVNASGPAGFVALEYDTAATPELLAAALERLAPFDAVIYTSASATPECPRFRVVLRPDRPAPHGAAYAAAVAAVGDLLGVPPAPESRQRTRIWYRPIAGSRAWVLTGGAPWPVPDVPEREAPPPRSPLTPDELQRYPADERVRLAWSALDRRRPEGMFGAALLCRDHGLEPDAAVTLVDAYARALAWDYHPDDVVERVDHAYAYAQGEPGSALVPTVATLPKIEAIPEHASAGAHVWNDAGNADRLVEIYGPHLRHALGVGWLAWDGTRWIPRPKGPWREAEACARLVLAEGRKIGGEAGAKLAEWGRQCGDARRLEAAIKVAAHRDAVSVDAARLDADPWLLGVPNGVVDLRTGQLREARREDLITRQAGVAYDPTATCPRFVRFMHECMGGDAELVGYLLRWGGYALTGLVREHALAVWHGADGANGKSTLINLLAHVLGDYHGTAASEVLLASGAGQHPTGLMDLRGRRLVTSNEAPEGKAWNEARIKQLSGGDVVKARAMACDYVDLRPTWKIVLATNSRPLVREQGGALWRRLQLVPWAVSFRGREDRDLEAALARESAGVLALLVRSCLEWAREGLAPPAAVLAAGNDYRTSQDAIGEFLAETTTALEGGRVVRAALYAAYRWWAQSTGEHTYPASAFYRVMVERGFAPYRLDTGERGFKGLALRAAG